MLRHLDIGLLAMNLAMDEENEEKICSSLPKSLIEVFKVVCRAKQAIIKVIFFLFHSINWIIICCLLFLTDASRTK